MPATPFSRLLGVGSVLRRVAMRLGSRFGLVLVWLAVGAGVVRQVAAQQAERAEAVAAERQGDVSGAETLWLQMSAAEPKNPEPLAHLGLLESRQEHYGPSIGYYERALVLKPDFPGLRMNLGLAEFKAGQFPLAIRTFQAELKQHPGDLRLTILLGMSHYGMGDYLVAVPYLKRAAAQDAQNETLRLTLAHSCLWSKQFACVMDTVKEMLVINPESAEADMLAGEALDETGNEGDATVQFRAAVAADPMQVNAQFGLGYLLWKQGNYSEAVRPFEAELVNDPKHAEARAYLGDCHVAAGNYASAEPELVKALEDDPSLAMAHRDLGITYASTGRNPLAVEQLQKAIALDGSDIAPHWRLAKVYQQMGEKDKAKDEFRIAGKMTQSKDEVLSHKIGGDPVKR